MHLVGHLHIAIWCTVHTTSNYPHLLHQVQSSQMAITSRLCRFHTLHYALRGLASLCIVMASKPPQLLPCMYESSVSRWIMLFFFFYWQYGEIQDYRQSLSPATLFIKNASVWMTNKNVASVLNRCKLLLIQCTLFKFYNVKLLPKGDNAVICAWTLRRQQWPFESSSLSLVQT